jgi:hypothetical protein
MLAMASRRWLAFQHKHRVDQVGGGQQGFLDHIAQEFLRAQAAQAGVGEGGAVEGETGHGEFSQPIFPEEYPRKPRQCC